MARTPRKEGARKKRGNKGASGRRGAPKLPRKRARKSAAKLAKTSSNRRAPGARAKAEIARLSRELGEALAQQTATSEVLQVISSSTGDVQPVFDQVLEKATKVCGAEFGAMGLYDGDVYRRVAVYNVPPAFDIAAPREWIPVSDAPIGRVLQTGQVVRVDDLRADAAYEARHPAMVAMVDVAGARTLVVVPMLRNAKPIGAISIYRQEVRPFSDKQVELLKNFASQAVIAIENARLFDETREALERQTATSDILKVIAGSPDDVQPVFDAIVASAARLVGAFSAGVYRFVDDLVHLAAITTVSAAGDEAIRVNFPRPIGDDYFRTAQAGEVVEFADTEDQPSARLKEVARIRGFRSIIYVPLKSSGISIGVIAATRQAGGSFAAHHIELLQTFADQAVIAIENTRLFNETREALARQTATADVLKVIASSPSNLQPVFDAIAARSNELIGGHSTTVGRYVDGMVQLAAFTPVSPEADAKLRTMFPSRPTDGDPQIAQVLRGEIARIAEAETEIRDSAMRETARARGWRSRLIVPLKDDTAVIGWISVTRKETGEFADKDVELLRTFADQAVIAIQNVELFEEVQARTRDLQESLQQQTATADVLKVISRSVFDLQAVLDTLVESAYKLCGASLGLLYLRSDKDFECKAIAGVGVEAATQLFKGRPIRAGRGTAAERVILTGEVHAVTDFFADPAFDPVVRERIRNDSSGSDISQLRSTLAVPMTRENEVVGVLVIARTHTGPFPQRQVELLQTFADQAVIAIENLRLFNETREALARQTATADVLKVIASSPSNLQPVFDAIAERSKALIGGHSTTVFRFAGEMVELVGATSVGAEADAVLRSTFPMPVSRMQNIERVLRGEVAEIVDAMAGTEPDASRNVARARGWRSRLVVPLKGDNEVIGFISITRKETGGFVEKDVELVRTFADQAVIAIQNVELFEEVQARTRELSQSLEDLRAAQDRLVQTEKLASLGQLTAGIAHEIKNPLNFVNNFSALSVELTDELNDVLSKAELAEKIQHDVNELTQLLKSNLEKVVQHGKRADSIVKNMLLHSREGSGEQRATDVNALVEESLNLAYHGARAEKSGFSITLQREFDAGAGSAELFPQEITRALLNLISNGFYAATRRKAENGDGAFEPTLLARTRDLGGSVEIRIRDNGTGIPPEVKEKMFNPFFTTKPAGEGTGLGLSMTHDIIVKQHGGTIDVTTESGDFTEFIVVLPRANRGQGKTRGPV
jgi:GAF domain-containing protein